MDQLISGDRRMRKFLFRKKFDSTKTPKIDFESISKDPVPTEGSSNTHYLQLIVL